MTPDLQIRLWIFMLAGGSPARWISEAKARGHILADDNSHLAMLEEWRDRGWYDDGAPLDGAIDRGWLTARGALGAEWNPWGVTMADRAKAPREHFDDYQEAA